MTVLGSGCAMTTQHHVTYPRSADSDAKCEVSGKWKLDAAVAVVAAAATVAGILLATSSNPSNSDVYAGGTLGAVGGLGTVLFGGSAVNGALWNGECERAKEELQHPSSSP